MMMIQRCFQNKVCTHTANYSCYRKVSKVSFARPATQHTTSSGIKHIRHFHSSKSNNRAFKEFSSDKSSSKYLYDVHVACRGKNCSLENLKNYDSSDKASVSPESCGEDSFFVSETIFGVADGVGGWNESGVDPSAMSRSLMHHCKEYAIEKKEQVSPAKILSEGYKRTLLDKNVDAGSTTACIVRIVQQDNNSQPILEYSNLGDSGFIIFRDNKILFKSKFQNYGLAPYQLAKIPPRFRDHGAIESQPDEADSGKINLEKNDIIIMATDGVWDNFARDLKSHPAFSPPVKIWSKYWHGNVKGLDEVIVKEKDIANNILQAAIENDMKPDDITVLVIKILGD